MRRLELTDPWFLGLSIAAAANLANAAWMLLDPAGWYAGLPAAVPDSGPLNSHFVRDIGSAFAMIGVALAAAAVRPALRAPALAVTGLFYALHALVHASDTIAGRLPASHWAIDFPGVYLPTVIVLFATAAAFRAARP